MRRILFVHHSADMYGADRVLLALVQELDKTKFLPIVVLPSMGPLVVALNEAGIETHVVALLKVGRTTMNIRGVIKLPLQVFNSLRAIDFVLFGRQVDIVHSNTLAVLSGALWAWKNKRPHVWHVHEIIVHPWLVRKMYGWLLRLFASKVICVSNATKQFVVDEQPTMRERVIVVWNGINSDASIKAVEKNNLREKLGLQRSDCLVVLVGRINRWKGQRLLVEAAGLLEKQGINNVHYLIVGSTPVGQEFFLSNLLRQISSSPAKNKITVLPFAFDVQSVWDAVDVVVVPSIEPEPFGMVTIEAMHARKPVIASDHGGSSEIVIHEVTGLLFEPGKVDELAASILKLVKNETERTLFGERGYGRVREFFTLRGQVDSICKVYDSI